MLKETRSKLKGMKLLDRYILKQVIEMFLMGVLVFTSIDGITIDSMHL